MAPFLEKVMNGSYFFEGNFNLEDIPLNGLNLKSMNFKKKVFSTVSLASCTFLTAEAYRALSVLNVFHRSCKEA